MDCMAAFDVAADPVNDVVGAKVPVLVSNERVWQWNMMMGNNPDVMDVGWKLNTQNVTVTSTPASVPAICMPCGGHGNTSCPLL